LASAGTGEAVPLGEITEQAFSMRSSGLNTRGTPVYGSEGVAAVFNDGGSIFMTGSVASVKGFSWVTACIRASKGGIALIRTHLAQRTEGPEYPGETC